MHIDLTGKRAVVTGSSRGIGRAVAGSLAAAGADVVLVGRTRTSLEHAAQDIGTAATQVVADLATAEGCARLVEAVPACDILVNNVAMFPNGPFADTPDSQWDAVWQLNVMSGVRLARAYLPGQIRTRWGRIVFVSSESAYSLQPGLIPYGVSKLALLALSRGLAKAAASSGVTVNTVVPGPTMTDALRQALPLDSPDDPDADEKAAAFVRANRPTTLLGRAATPDEVAHLVTYVCSAQASATTGAALRVDGGVVDSVL